MWGDARSGVGDRYDDDRLPVSAGTPGRGPCAGHHIIKAWGYPLGHTSDAYQDLVASVG